MACSSPSGLFCILQIFYEVDDTVIRFIFIVGCTRIEVAFWTNCCLKFQSPDFISNLRTVQVVNNAILWSNLSFVLTFWLPLKCLQAEKKDIVGLQEQVISKFSNFIVQLQFINLW